VDTKALTAVVAATIAEDGDCFWDVDDVGTPGVIRVRLGLNPDFSDAVTLEDLGTGAFLLEIGGYYLLPEFDYDEETQHEVVTRQTQRGLGYIHGHCSETVNHRGEVIISRQLTFPDGATARSWLPPWQRLRARITGKSSTVRTSSHD
jgi:hypothetical protein